MSGMAQNFYVHAVETEQAGGRSHFCGAFTREVAEQTAQSLKATGVCLHIRVLEEIGVTEKMTEKMMKAGFLIKAVRNDGTKCQVGPFQNRAMADNVMADMARGDKYTTIWVEMNSYDQPTESNEPTENQ